MKQEKPIVQALGPLMCDIAGLQLTEKEIQRLLHPMVGGVILFARNYKDKTQLVNLIHRIKKLRSPELLVAVDQEGGRVQRFKDGFTVLPTARSFGELWDKDSHTAPIAAFESARIMARELVEVGVDFSFAPIFDIETQESEVIGDRSFHHKPKAVIDLVGAYIDGMHTEGMACIAKHFPGHGGVAGDSHACLPTDVRTFSELKKHDLLPYRALLNEIDGIMTAHVHFPACDANIPTYSKFWLSEVLKESMGFQGIVFSDDLTMQGAIDADEKMQSIAIRAQTALEAGCDMILVCNNPEEVDELLSTIYFESNQKLSGRLTRLQARLKEEL